MNSDAGSSPVQISSPAQTEPIKPQQDAGISVRELRVASAVPFGPAPHRSGIDKQPVANARVLTTDGLVGDEQGDTKHHGGREKALHHYALEHYATWRAEYPDIAWRLATPGAFGENIVTLGLDETTVCVGDVFDWGTAQIQVSQARQPCWRLNVRFDQPKMARWVQQSGRTGWYYRVLRSGTVSADDPLVLAERSAPDWSLARLLYYLYVDTLNRDALESIADLSLLTDGWRELATKRLQRASVEDWQSRVTTPDA